MGVRGAGPDTIAFLAGDTLLAQLDGRYLSTEVATGFIGRVIGMYVTHGSAAFDWFDYQPKDD
jgi:xylan 1,4-beta-xylosidase